MFALPEAWLPGTRPSGAGHGLCLPGVPSLLRGAGAQHTGAPIVAYFPFLFFSLTGCPSAACVEGGTGLSSRLQRKLRTAWTLELAR